MRENERMKIWRSCGVLDLSLSLSLSLSIYLSFFLTFFSLSLFLSLSLSFSFSFSVSLSLSLSLSLCPSQIHLSLSLQQTLPGERHHALQHAARRRRRNQRPKLRENATRALRGQGAHADLLVGQQVLSCAAEGERTTRAAGVMDIMSERDMSEADLGLGERKSEKL
jgi:hypothetical protein